MKLLIVAHHGDTAERERAYDLVNKFRHGGISFMIADLNSSVLNADILRLRIRHADALVILQSGYMIPQATLHDEPEINRAERLAIEIALQHDKPCGIIGKSPGLLSAHVLKHSSSVQVVGPFCEPRDTTGGLADSFTTSDIVPVSDMERGVQAFMTKLEQHVLAKRKKVKDVAA